jgi:hypothetical protein
VRPTDSDVVSDTLRFIDARRGHLLLHAGGAATSDGRAVIVHGESGAGKTTLTTALVSRDLAYITDETVCLDPKKLEIEPFTKPLTVKPGSQELLAHLRPPDDEVSEHSGNWQLPPERLGGPTLPKAPLRPGLIVFPDVDAERDGVQVTAVSPARAAFVLGEQSSAMWAIEPRPLAALERLVTSVPAYQVSYANAFDAAPVIAALLTPGPDDLEDSGRNAGVSRPKPQDHQISEERERAPSGTRGPRRADGVDWVVLEGEAVLFDGEHLHHLDGPGAAVWLALDGEVPLPEVAAELAAHFGVEANDILLDVEDLVLVLRSRLLVEG